MQELVQTLANRFATARADGEMREASVSAASALLDADVCLLVARQDGGFRLAARDPEDWTDTDGLVSPVSLIGSALTQRTVGLVDDRGAVRRATDVADLQSAPAVEYRSVAVVPYGQHAVLAVAARQPEAFSESDVERLQSIAAFATVRRDALASADEPAVFEEVGAILSHDAKNYLTIIQGQLEIVREDPEAGSFETIDRAASRLDALLEDTRTLLRYGDRATDETEIDLERAVTESWSVLDVAGATLEVGDLGTIRAERTGLDQVLENLFRNSVDHAGPDVTVRVGMLDGTGLFVEDDGPGIPPGERETVFEFGHTSADGNTGFGLAIVEWIAEAHGWEVAVTESDLGGARFEIRGVTCLDG